MEHKKLTCWKCGAEAFVKIQPEPIQKMAEEKQWRDHWESSPNCRPVNLSIAALV